MGVPWTIYMGRPQPQPGEPLWTAEDRDVAEAWRLYQAHLCGGCGTHEHDAHGTDNDNRWGVDARVCRVCQALELDQQQRQKAAREQAKSGPAGEHAAALGMAGLRVFAFDRRLRDDAPSAGPAPL